jgi:mRNA interferase MazF
VYLVVSRQELLDSKYSTAVCVPVYSALAGLETEVPVGPTEGLKHDSCLRCDEVTSVPKAALQHFVGSLSQGRFRELDLALIRALDIERSPHQ